jgi:hypothetical protein
MADKTDESIKYSVEQKAYFAGRKNGLETETAGLDRRYNVISAVRAVVFLGAIVALIIGLKDNVPFFTAAGICLAIVFMILVKKHEKLATAQMLKKAELEVTDRYVQRFDDGWRDFPDDGSEFLQKNDTVPVDIDLLGKASVYQLINTAHTPNGRGRLAEALRELPEVKAGELKERNAAVYELGQNVDFAIAFETLGQELERHQKRKKGININEFQGFCMDDEKGDMPGWAKLVRIIFPAAFFLLLILGITGVCGLGPAVIMFFITLCFSWITKSVTDSVIAPFYSISFAITDYKKMMELISDTEFESSRLKKLKKLYSGKDGVLPAFAKLNAICQAYNIVFNPLVHQVLSGILLWDYQLAHSTAKWKKRYGSKVGEAFDGIYEMEFLLSLSVLPKIRNTVTAKLEADVTAENTGLSLTARGVYHPLISSDRVVENDANLKSGITIITGSNMSGKTTFLRTVAVNLALAYIGAPVCAKEFSAAYMKIFTSMRVTDDVANGISTFYAEILRIKAMAEFKESTGGKVPMLCMVDEIFKGTNSADRIVGAKEAIKRLAGAASMVVVSTHDFELCTVEDENHNPAVNYHFEEYYEDDKLMFDYKIRDGRCTTTNARAILKMAHILH